jgi:hypothetical protein
VTRLDDPFADPRFPLGRAVRIIDDIAAAMRAGD